MRDLRDDIGTAIVLITHDLGVVAEMCDRVAVMYAGEIVEHTDVTSLFSEPLHPYTRGLIGSIPSSGTSRTSWRWSTGNVPNLIDLPKGCRFAPRCVSRVEEDVAIALEVRPKSPPDPSGPRSPLLALPRCPRRPAATARAERCGVVMTVAAPVDDTASGVGSAPAPADTERPLVRVRDLVKHFPIRGRVDAADRRLGPGRGRRQLRGPPRRDTRPRRKSGCGKDDRRRLIVRLIEPTAGSIEFDGTELTTLKDPP